jgi:uncharacterized protein YecT (DUF1311 family)
VVAASSGSSQQRRPWKIDERGEPYPATVTSFDCGKATHRIEQMICHDRNLAFEDDELGETFWFLRKELSAAQLHAVTQSQKAWIVRRNSCADRHCVERAYDERLSELHRLSDARRKYLRRNLTRVGQCEGARIEWIGTRLTLTEGAPPDGTGVVFTDGVYQVSYDRVRAILASRVGDPVRVCLASIPRDCPVGDDRGRFYRVTNLRTGGEWHLPDAEHMCGGA